VEDDDGVLCAVCGSTDGHASDPIVFCDGCDLMVHASCYGNPLAQSIPDGDWFCSVCFAKKSKAVARPSCCLCPAKGGAMKRTTEGQWAHISCALLVPEVFFQDPDGRDGVDCSGVPAHRFTKECYICESSIGCALECSQPKCSRGFHVSCGLDGGLCIEYREEKRGAIVAGFCREHTELWQKVNFRTTSTNCKLACRNLAVYNVVFSVWVFVFVAATTDRQVQDCGKRAGMI
jgi:NuA3 HAT complex component NTO1